MSLISEVAQYLEDNSVGTVGTDIFYSYLPDNDLDVIIAVLENTEQPPEKEIPTNRPEFQIFIRAKDYATGRAKYDAIRALLHKNHYAALVVGGTYLYYSHLRSGGHIGRNGADGEDEFSMNFETYTR